MPNNLSKIAIGVTKKKKIIPKMSGVVTFDSVKPNNIHNLVKYFKIFGFKNEIRVVITLTNNKDT